MNGVTGRMGTNQHLIRSIAASASRAASRWPMARRVPRSGAGRPQRRQAARAGQAHGDRALEHQPDAELANPDDHDLLRRRRPRTMRADGGARRSPPASISTARSRSPTDLATALELARLANAAGVKNGVVQDKLFLPGLLKMKRLIDGGFFGRILSVRGEFGYWVFEGDWQPAQRPSLELPRRGRRRHHRGYAVPLALCARQSVRQRARGILPRRNAHSRARGRAGQALRGHRRRCGLRDIRARWRRSSPRSTRRGACACIATSCSRFQVDGTHGSAVAGLRECVTQHRADTPRPVWNPDMPSPIDFWRAGRMCPTTPTFDNGFKVQWEQFLRHVVRGRADSAGLCWKAPRACSWPSWAALLARAALAGRAHARDLTHGFRPRAPAAASRRGS